MDATILINLIVSVLIAVGGVTGTIYAARSTRRSQQLSQASVDHNADRDQLQEDLAALRVEFNTEREARRVEREKDQREIRYHKGIIRHVDDEINELRKMMTDAGLTPPPRKAWPAYPGEWTEDRI
jgi:outer membrane murein-binding lipoprotein Lpp